MKKHTNYAGILNLSPRTFTFSQLSKISDDNYGVLNRSMDMSAFNTGDIFVLEPRMFHYHAFGEEVHPHLRTLVTKLNESKPLAYQDIKFDRWELGKELDKIAS